MKDVSTHIEISGPPEILCRPKASACLRHVGTPIASNAERFEFQMWTALNYSKYFVYPRWE